MVENQYNIKLDPTAHPVHHVPRRVPVAIRDKVKAALDDLVKKEVVAEVKQPTEWISSMVTVPKKNGQLRIRLDPKDLNTDNNIWYLHSLSIDESHGMVRKFECR